MTIKYPNVHVALEGEDGNAFFIIGRVRRAMRQAGIAVSELDAYREQAMAGDYDHLLRTTMEWVSTDEDEE